MTALDTLRETLTECLAVRAPAPSPTTPLSQALARLRQMRQRRTAGSAAPHMTQTLFQLRLGGRPTSSAGLRKLCANLSRSTGWEQQRVIDDPRLLDSVLHHVESLATGTHRDGWRFARCYRALLSSYFSLPPADIGGRHAGGRTLGEFLRRTHASAGLRQSRSGGQALLRQCLPLLDWPVGGGCSPEQRRRLCLRLGVASNGWLNREE